MVRKRKSDKMIITTLVLIAVVIVCFLGVSWRVEQIARESCYATLENAASQVIVQVQNNVENDREQLRVMAGVLSDCSEIDSQEAREMIRSFELRTAMTGVGLLLPDNEMILSKGDLQDGPFDFRREKEKLPYLSEVVIIKQIYNQKMIYQAVPVEKNGKIEGILYGFIKLEELSQDYKMTAYGEESALYVIDGKTGNFLVDTWHDELGNIRADKFRNKEAKGKEQADDIDRDFREGRTGYIAFKSEKAGEYLYACYKAVGIKKWMVMVSVPESEAFRDLDMIRNVLYVIGGTMVISLLVYFLAVLRKVRKDTERKEYQLAQSIYMLEVQQILFNAHKDRSKIRKALRKTMQTLGAEKVFLFSIEERIRDFYSWPLEEKDWQKHFLKEGVEAELPEMRPRLRNGESIIVYPKSMTEKEKMVFEKYKVFNLMMVPVINLKGELIGVLGGMNMKYVWRDAVALECVAGSFLMALENFASWKMIQKMGIQDALTGLKNRNCYQHEVVEYAKQNEKSLCCIYMDLNGLHEVNNYLGHAEGDAMLRKTGELIRDFFGEVYSYRIGGDEFVVFCVGEAETEVIEKMDAFRMRMEEEDYHISIGYAWQKKVQNIDALILRAEERMYKAKNYYYEKQGNVEKARNMNQKLEKILTEKKDADMFLSIISSYFKGVYIVNMDTDLPRVIYIPEFFKKLLEEKSYNFSESMDNYIRSCVRGEDREKLLRFLDYEWVHKEIKAGRTLEATYKKTDGTRMKLRIYPAIEYSEEKKELLWLFEEY